MEKFYGKKVKFLTGIMLMIKNISFTSTQFIFLGVILKYFFQINEFWGIIIGGTILSVYSILGGINSVTKTDIFHFFVLIIIFPTISGILIYKIGGFKELIMKLPPNKLNIVFKDKIYTLSFLFYLSFSFSAIFNPAILQRAVISA
ncbi:MAG: hypothetical protein GY823_05755 [Flavobacteriaceae bacterium]|nr:hypothetical protein [Flavobacteriaceae bacterium]